jgi:hypothetical protein
MMDGAGLGAARRFAGLAAALVGAALAPSVAVGSQTVGYQYLTTYEGGYSFTERYRAEPDAPDGLDTTQLYDWVTYDYETIRLHPDRSFTRTLTRYVIARGDARQVDVQGSGVSGGPFTTTSTCRFDSDRKPVDDTSGGPYIQPVTVRSNPRLGIGWTLPLPSYSGNPPPFRASGTPDRVGCSLFWTISEPAGTVYTSLPPTRRMARAFGGGTTIRYSKLENGPWSRSFKNVTIQGEASRPGFRGPSTESAKVVVNSKVTFERVYNTTLPGAEPVAGDKLAALLIDEGFLGLKGQGTPGGPPVGALGDPETVIVPGLGPGQLSLDVHAIVLQNRRVASKPRVRAAAAGEVSLASATARVTRAGRPVQLKIVPTAAGRDLLKARHGKIAGRYILGFRPRGSRRTYHAVEALTIPARP